MLSIYEYIHYRDYLNAIFAERQKANPLYSLRRFAAHLKMSQSMLTLVLSGEQKITITRAKRLNQYLKHNDEQAEFFLLLVRKALASDESSKKELDHETRRLMSLNESYSIELSKFKPMAEWFHIPLIEMIRTQTKTNVLQISHAAKRLGIEESKLKATLHGMARLGIIEIQEGRYKISKKRILIESDESEKNLQSFHQEMLKKASESIALGAATQQFMGTETFTLDPILVPKASKILNKAFDDVNKMIAKHKKKSKSNDAYLPIYHLAMCLFDLSHLYGQQIPEEKKRDLSESA